MTVFFGGGDQIISKSETQIRFFDLMNVIEIIIFNSQNPLIQQNFIVYQEIRPRVLCLITNILLWIVESQAGNEKARNFFVRLDYQTLWQISFLFFCFNSKFISKSSIFPFENENTNTDLLKGGKFMDLRNSGVNVDCNG